MPAEVLSSLESADAVLHAGDVLDAGVLERLADIAPVHAVLGNNDAELVGHLPLRRVVDLAGLRIGMVHDSGPRAGREKRLHTMFPDCQVVVFGHSHIPWATPGVDGQLLFNPGSPTQRRRQPVATFGRIEVNAAEVVSARIVPVAR